MGGGGGAGGGGEGGSAAARATTGTLPPSSCRRWKGTRPPRCNGRRDGGGPRNRRREGGEGTSAPRPRRAVVAASSQSIRAARSRCCKYSRADPSSESSLRTNSRGAYRGSFSQNRANTSRNPLASRKRSPHPGPKYGTDDAGIGFMSWLFACGSTQVPGSQASTGRFDAIASWYASPWVSCSQRKTIARDLARSERYPARS